MDVDSHWGSGQNRFIFEVFPDFFEIASTVCVYVWTLINWYVSFDSKFLCEICIRVRCPSLQHRNRHKRSTEKSTWVGLVATTQVDVDLINTLRKHFQSVYVRQGISIYSQMIWIYYQMIEDINLHTNCDNWSSTKIQGTAPAPHIKLT